MSVFKRSFLVVLLFAGFMTSHGQNVPAQTQNDNELPLYYKNRSDMSPDGSSRSKEIIIIKLKDVDLLPTSEIEQPAIEATSIQTQKRIEKKNIVISRHRLGSAREIFPQTKNSRRAKRYYQIEVPEGMNIDSVIQELEADPEVEWAEPVITFSTEAIQPNDPEYIDKNRQYLNILNLEEAWSTHTGSEDVVIAIVDTGVDYLHEDLDDNIWINTNEIPGNGIDDDANGFVDDERGWDFVSVDASSVPEGEDANPPDNDPMDYQGHGTHVAGIAGAEGNNGIGVTGIAWNIKLMAIRAGYANDFGGGSLGSADVAAALYYACENGANIVNMSFITIPPSMIVKDAIDYCSAGEVLLVAGAGNNFNNKPVYPAAYGNVLAVAATNYGNYKAVTSNYGIWVDIAAPGVNIYSTEPNNSYGLKSGTSMAAPIVSGLAALIKSRFSGFSSEDVVLRLLAPSILLGPAESKYYKDLGAGVIQADLTTETVALPRHLNVVSIHYEEDGEGANGFISAGEVVNISPTIRNYSGKKLDLTINLSTTDPFLTIIDGTITMNGVSHNRKVTPKTDVFQISLVEGMPNNYIGEFSITISDATGAIYHNDFNTTVFNPLLKSEIIASSLPSTTQCVNPRLIEHPDHTISMIYECGYDYDTKRLYHRIRDSNGMWSEERVLPNLHDRTQQSPSLAMGSDGRLHVIYKQWVGDGDDEIYYAVFDPGAETWQTTPLTESAVLDLEGNSSISTVQIALNKDDRPVVFWTDWRGGTADIYMMQYDGAEWSDELLVFDLDLTNDHNFGRFQIFYFEDVNAVPTLIWNQKTGDELFLDLYYSQYLVGSWSTPALVTTNKIINFDAGIDSNNIIHLVFADSGGAGGAYDYYHSTFNGIGWDVSETMVIKGQTTSPGGQLLHQLVINNSDQPEVYESIAFDGVYRSIFDGVNWGEKELFYSDSRIASDFDYLDSIYLTGNNEYLLALIDIQNFDLPAMPLYVLSSNEYKPLVPEKPSVIITNNNNNTKLTINTDTDGSQSIAGYYGTLGSAPGIDDLFPFPKSTAGTQIEIDLAGRNTLLPEQRYYANVRAFNSTRYLSAPAIGRVNAFPSLSILQPNGGSVYEKGEILNLSAQANDLEDLDISKEITWRSDINGVLGTGNIKISNLEPGSHLMTASISDTDGATTTQEISIEIIFTDSDNDGIQDNYEAAHGLNANDAADAAQDRDADGLSNLQEFLLGTSIDYSDTDHDAISDAEEVNSGRNPLINEPAIIQLINSFIDE